MPFDLRIQGSWGLYSILPATRKGKRWQKKHLSKGERTVLNGATVCEGGDNCRAIVAGAVKDGCALLTVGKPGLRQERFVVERLVELEQKALVFFDRGGYYLSPTGKEARDIYLATARALVRRGR